MIKIKSKREVIFQNAKDAIRAAQAIEYHYAKRGILTASNFNTKAKSIEVTIYFNLTDNLTLPWYHNYSERELRSHTYYSPVTNQLEYCRCMTFHFNY